MKLDKNLYHNIQLKNVQMIGLKTVYNESNEFTSEKNNKNYPLCIEVKNDSKVISETRGICYLNVEVGFKEKDDELFNIEVIYRGLCEATNKIDKDEMEFYLKFQSVPMLWAYVRETINNVMLKMGLPPIVLPAVNINRMVESIANENNRKEGEK